jgi:folate-binding protein YgfZ
MTESMHDLFFSSLGHRGVIAVSGPDRAAFLQGLISNDASRVSPEHAEHAALLTAQGRFQFDMFLVELAGTETMLLEVERDRAADLIKRLSLYKLRSKVTIESRLDVYEVAVAFGAGAAAGLGLADARGAARAIDDAVAFVDPRLPALGVRMLAPRGMAAVLLSAKGFGTASEDDYEALRLRLGVPDGSRDLPVDKAFLLENGFDELNGIDWKKGCYMGQELTARTKYRGLVRKRLLPVEVEGPMPAPGTIVMLGEKEAGEMRSGRAGQALALLRLEMVENARRAGSKLTAGEAKIAAHIPDWVKLPEPDTPA